MGRSHKKISLERSKYTNKAWLTDGEGKRITKRFKINTKTSIGKFVVLETSKGTIVYHRHQQDILYNGLGSKSKLLSVYVNKVAKNIYVVRKGLYDYWLYNAEGELMCGDRLDNVIPTSSGLIAVRKNGLWGFWGDDGKWVFEPKFHTISEFYENGYCIVGIALGTKIDIIDKLGNFVLEPLCYQAARFIKTDLLIVTNQGRHGVINLNGEQIVSPEYDTITFKHNFFIVQKGNKFGIIDTEGQQIFECIYSSIEEKDGGFVIHTKNEAIELSFN